MAACMEQWAPNALVRTCCGTHAWAIVCFACTQEGFEWINEARVQDGRPKWGMVSTTVGSKLLLKVDTRGTDWGLQASAGTPAGAPKQQQQVSCSGMHSACPSVAWLTWQPSKSSPYVLHAVLVCTPPTTMAP